MSEYSFEQGEKEFKSRLRPGTADISESAVWAAINHVRLQKELAIEKDDHEEVASWRDEEKALLAALGGYGLRFLTE